MRDVIYTMLNKYAYIWVKELVSRYTSIHDDASLRAIKHQSSQILMSKWNKHLSILSVYIGLSSDSRTIPRYNYMHDIVL